MSIPDWKTVSLLRCILWIIKFFVLPLLPQIKEDLLHYFEDFRINLYEIKPKHPP